MTKTAITSILGMVVSLVAVNFAKADGYFFFDNYDSGGPAIVYGAGSGGPVGAGIDSSFTVGLDYAFGNVTGSVASDPGGVADPSTLGGGLTLLTGNPYDTAVILYPAYPLPGLFTDSNVPIIPGFTSGLVTLEVVAYNGSSYDNSTIRGHSSAFTITPVVAPGIPPTLGEYMPIIGYSPLLDSPSTVAFYVYPVPEPSMSTFVSLGGLICLLFRRRPAVNTES